VPYPTPVVSVVRGVRVVDRVVTALPVGVDQMKPAGRGVQDQMSALVVSSGKRAIGVERLPASREQESNDSQNKTDSPNHDASSVRGKNTSGGARRVRAVELARRWFTRTDNRKAHFAHIEHGTGPVCPTSPEHRLIMDQTGPRVKDRRPNSGRLDEPR
jgi:hypothetical protein